MGSINLYAAQVAGRVGNDFSTLLASMPNKFFCLTSAQEDNVWKTVMAAYDSGVHNIQQLKRVAHQAVEGSREGMLSPLGIKRLARPRKRGNSSYNAWLAP